MQCLGIGYNGPKNVQKRSLDILTHCYNPGVTDNQYLVVQYTSDNGSYMVLGRFRDEILAQLFLNSIPPDMLNEPFPEGV